jgi:hypothetical protein
MNKIKLVHTFLLSVIALGIIGILAQNQIIIGKLSQEKPEKSFVKQASFKPNQNFIALPVNPDGSIDVNIKNDEIDVNIEEVGGYNTYGTVNVKVED